MLYNNFQDLRLSALGFGTMRLPLLPDGQIDQAELDRMVDAAMAAGVNYYDTAYPYHGSLSEVAIGRSLARYPRESWYLATKFPGHQNVHGVKPLLPEEVFEEQLRKCGVEFFDFYLIHNVNEKSLAYYGNPENRFMDYFVSRKRTAASGTSASPATPRPRGCSASSISTGSIWSSARSSSTSSTGSCRRRRKSARS